MNKSPAKKNIDFTVLTKWNREKKRKNKKLKLPRVPRELSNPSRIKYSRRSSSFHFNHRSIDIRWSQTEMKENKKKESEKIPRIHGKMFFVWLQNRNGITERGEDSKDLALFNFFFFNFGFNRQFNVRTAAHWFGGKLLFSSGNVKREKIERFRKLLFLA